MYILKDQDIDFVVNDCLKEYTEETRRKVSAIIKLNRSQFSQFGQGRLLQEKISNEVKPDFNFDVLSNKLFRIREENDIKVAGFMFYQCLCHSVLCDNNHRQMNKKIFKFGEDNYYYVKKAGKLLVRKERPQRMPKGSLYNAKRFCNCVMVAYNPEDDGLSVVDKEPERKPNIKKDLAAEEGELTKILIALLVILFIFVLIIIFLL